LPGLECADGTEEEKLECEPLAGPNTVESHVCRDLEQHDTKREHLLTDVELVLIDADVFEEVVRDGIGDVTTIELPVLALC
jgi:hypothetical protein